MIRVVVVDDTILYRTLVSEALSKIPDVRVVATAPNGKIALSKIYTLKPDMITLDIEMPEMNGIEVLQALANKELDSAVVMVSSLTPRGGELTMRALELGATDYVLKPEGGNAGLEELSRTLGVIVSGIRRKREIGLLLKGGRIQAIAAPPAKPEPVKPKSGVKAPLPGSTLPSLAKAVEIVAIGASTGGPQALLTTLPQIKGPLKVPLLIVQHMPPVFTANLARSLAARCQFPVKEAENGEILKAGVAYIAPGGFQMKIALAADAKTQVLRVTDDLPEHNCKPSVDFMLRAVAHLYYGRALAVIMTGMGSDGTEGLGAIKRAGGLVLAQDEASSVVWGMPKAAVDAGVVDVVLPLDSIAAAINHYLAGKT